MGLSRTQTNELVGKIQHLLDNPIKQINWELISQLFPQMLEQGIEYDDGDVEYIVRKLKFPDKSNIGLFFSIADEPLSNYKFTKNLKAQMIDFQLENKELVNFLSTLKFPRVSRSIISSETDYYYLIDGFEELLRNGIEYDPDDIRNWLTFSKPNNGLEDNVIEEIAQFAHFIQMYLKKPKKPM